MQIYGTLTSERAMKSQGGNDRLSVEITVGENEKRQTILTAIVERTETGNGLADKYVLWLADIPVGSVIIDK